MASTKDKVEFAFLMGRHSTMAESTIQRILRYGSTLNRLAVKQCNEPWTDSDQRKRERVQARVRELCLQHGTAPRFSNDPRGATIKIAVPDGYTNDWGREGICVPTS
jgi:hypothetical protein